VDPDPHLWHVSSDVAATAAENLPSGHGWQVVLLLAPTTPEYVPAAQGWHAENELARLVSDQYPAGHGVHAPLLALMKLPTPQLVTFTALFEYMVSILLTRALYSRP